MLALGVSLAISAVFWFVLTIPPERYSDTLCDAYSLTHFTAAITGGGALIVLGLCSHHLETTLKRLGAAAFAGTLLLAVLYHCFPACFGDPLVNVHPVLRTIWLDNVMEAQPLLKAIHQPGTLEEVVPLILGAMAAFILLLCSGAQNRSAWILASALIATGLAGSFWQVRVICSFSILSMLGAAAILALVNQRLSAHMATIRIIAPCLIGLIFAQAAWIALTPTKPNEAATKNLKACTQSDLVAQLSQIPSGTVLAHIDIGAHILAFTPHSVIAAPYHRNNQGNLDAAQLWLGDAGHAQETVRRRKVDYLIWCESAPDFVIYNQHAPQGFAAQVSKGQIPDWLEKVAGFDGIMNIYKTRLPSS
jgi:hypothetical protein